MLPLHIFEGRYRAMVTDCLARDKRMAVVGLKPGFEESYEEAAVYAVAGVGRILRWTGWQRPLQHLLKGEARVRIDREIPADTSPRGRRHALEETAGRARRGGAGGASDGAVPGILKAVSGRPPEMEAALRDVAAGMLCDQVASAVVPDPPCASGSSRSSTSKSGSGCSQRPSTTSTLSSRVVDDQALVALLLLVILAAPATAAGTPWGWLGIRIRDLSEQEMDEISKKYGLREASASTCRVMKETPPRARAPAGGPDRGLPRRPVVDTRTLQRLIAHTTSGDTIGLPFSVAKKGAGASACESGPCRMPSRRIAWRPSSASRARSGAK